MELVDYFFTNNCSNINSAFITNLDDSFFKDNQIKRMRIRSEKYCEDCGAELLEKLVPAKAVDSSFPRFALDTGERIFIESFICPKYCPEDKNHTRIAMVGMTIDGKLVFNNGK